LIVEGSGTVTVVDVITGVNLIVKGLEDLV
jgi:hypothetical protein